MYLASFGGAFGAARAGEVEEEERNAKAQSMKLAEVQSRLELLRSSVGSWLARPLAAGRAEALAIRSFHMTITTFRYSVETLLGLNAPNLHRRRLIQRMTVTYASDIKTRLLVLVEFCSMADFSSISPAQ